MKIKVDSIKLECLCEMAINDCEFLYKWIFGDECNRNGCWNECPFLNEDRIIEWLKKGREKL